MHRYMFFLDYESFRQEAQPLIELADQGNHAAVWERAEVVAGNIPRGEWILEDLGTTLRAIHFLSRTASEPHFTGFSFLVLLSQYLRPASPDNPGMAAVAKAVARLNWSSRDAQLLGDGMSTRSLLRPDLVTDVLQRPPAPFDDPNWYIPAHYWWHFSPGRAFYSGWWDVDLIEHLYRPLQAASDAIQQMDIAQLDLHPDFTKEMLQACHAETLRLFEAALEQRLGLYYIVR